MNQPFSAQGLTSIVGATLAVALVKHDRQASCAKKILFQHATDLKQITSNAASGGRSRPGLKNLLQDVTDLQQIFYVN